MGKQAGYIGKVILILLVVILAVGAGIYIKERSLSESRETGNEEQVQAEISVSPNPKVTPKKVKVSVYFGNSKLNPNSIDCKKVYPVEREVFQGNEVIGAIDALFGGPTADELKQGYTSFFSSKTKGINIGSFVKNGILYINFSSSILKLIPNVTTSCGSGQFTSEIQTTAKQFSGINKVYFAIESNPETYYNWMQVGCTPNADYCDATPFLIK